MKMPHPLKGKLSLPLLGRIHRGLHTKRVHLIKGRSRKFKVVAAIMGAVLAGGTAFAATSWTVGLAGSSSANAEGSSIGNLTISDMTSAPTETNQLYPSASYVSGTGETPGTGDVTFTLTNPNRFPVTVTGITIPEETINSASANDAIGFSGSTVGSGGSAISGCAASGSTTSSDVTWTDALNTGTNAVSFTSGSRGGETEVGAFAIAASATITVTLVDDAAMDSTAPLACAGTQSGSSPNYTYAGAYFVMPSLTTIAATGGTYSGSPTPTANGGSVITGY